MMRINSRYLLFVFGLLVISDLFSQAYEPKKLFYKIENSNYKQAVLYSYKGSSAKPIDTAMVQSSGGFAFFGIENYEPGVYTVKLSDSLFTELIFNKEDIFFKADSRNILKTAQVEGSIENKIYFDFWNFFLPIKDSINYLNIVIQKYEKIPNTNTSQIKTLKSRITGLRIKVINYIQKQRSDFPKAFAPVLLRAYQLPYYDVYLSDTNNLPYQNEFDYYYNHFFDNVNFSDSRLLNSRVVYNIVNDYMKTFGEPASTINYISMIDNVLRAASASENIYDFWVQTFLQNFDNTIWEDVFVHVVDKYYKPTHERHPEIGMYYFNTADKIKLLRAGNLFPKLVLTDNKGKTVDVSNIDAKVKMVIFYSSDCPHCEEAMPSLIEIHKKYSALGLKTIAVAIDEEEDVWKKNVGTKPSDWIFISDLKGLASPIMNDFHIFMTPTIFILDDKNIIVSKPLGPTDINTTLEDLLVK